MFDYVNKLQLALGDKARRTGLKIGAGIAALIGLGFLIAALWSWLAWNLELGPAMASLIIGGSFALIGVIIWAMAAAERHAMPTGTELKDEVEMRLSQATEAAFDMAKFKAESAMDNAQARVVSLFGVAEDKARNLVGTTEAKVHGLASGVGNVAGEAVKGAAAKVGLTSENLQDAKATIERATEHRAAPAVGLAGAFAIGMAIANALKSRRCEEDLYYDDEDEDYDAYEAEDDWRCRR